MAFRDNRVTAALIVAAMCAVTLAVWYRQAGRAAGDVTPRASPLETEAQFVGSTTCSSCHAPEAEGWRTSQHRRAMQEADSTTVLGNFADASFRYNNVESTFFRRDDGFWVRTDGSDGALADFRIRYTFGIHPLQQYLVEFPDGRVQALSIAWDARRAEEGGQKWFHLYAGDKVDHRDELHWTKRLQNWNFMCADCHSTNVRKGFSEATNRFKTSWSEMSVGCESCHGPGSRHVDWARASTIARRLFWQDNGLPARLDERRGVSWRVDPATSKPSRNTARTTSREIDTCAVCHSRRAQLSEGYFAGARLDDFYAVSALSRGLYHPDGQQRDEVYTYGSFLQSRMYAAGVTCSDCHDPHTAQLRADGNTLCAQCHVPATYDSPAHHFHQMRAGGTPPSCVSCHMPTKNYMTVDARRDHSFRVPRPDRTVLLGTPNACTACHSKETAEWAAAAVRRWLGRNAAGFQAFAGAFAAHDREPNRNTSTALAEMTVGDAPAIVRASAIERLAETSDASALETARLALSDADSTVRRLALGAFGTVDPRARLVALPLLADPVRAVRVEAARVLAPASRAIADARDRQNFNRAALEFAEASRLQADRPESRTSLGSFFIDAGKATEGVAEFRAAIRLDPGHVPAYVNLADALGRQGQEGDAEAALKQGLAANPGNASLHHALGLSLARAGRYAAAVSELARASELAPDVARFTYAHAVALHSTGRSAQAITLLERARIRHPRDRDLLIALATFHRDAGRTGQARAVAADLVRYFPADAEAGSLLDSLTSRPSQ